MIWLSIGIILAVWYLWFRIRNRRMIELAGQFPGPINLPLIGSIWPVIIVKPKDFILFVNDLSRRYGGIFRFWVCMHQVEFMITEARIAQIVLGHSHKYLAKSDVYGYLEPLLGDGILLSTGDKWRSRRKAITPAFHFKILEEFVEIFDRHSDTLIKQFDQLDGSVIDVHKYVQLMALDTICETAMGTKINAQLDKTSRYVHAIHEISTSVSMRMYKLWTRQPFLYWLFFRDSKRKQDEAIRFVKAVNNEIIQSRRQQLATAPAVAERSDDGIKRKQPLLDILLKSTVDGVPLSDSDILEEVNTFMFGGHDTISSAVCFTLHLLSRHPEVQEKVFREIKTIFGNKSIQTTHNNIQNMRYLDCVIKESMRLYPPVPIIARRLEEETVINSRQTIPANCNIAINLMVMFRDNRVFQRPDEFWPDRFEGGSLSNDSPTGSVYSFCAFSAGTRNCVGQKFAMTEIKCTISKIVRHFVLTDGGPELVLVNELILRSMSGMHMRLNRREY